MRSESIFKAALAALALSGSAHAQTFLSRDTADTVRVANWNIFNDSVFPGFGTADRQAAFGRVLRAVDADVWALQENWSASASSVLNTFNTQAPLPGGASWNIYRGSSNVLLSKFPLSLTGNSIGYNFRMGTALVDLPNDRFNADLYLINAHWKCCSGGTNQQQRQDEANVTVNWMNDARTPGGNINLPAGTPMVVLGDLNTVEGPAPLNTILEGNQTSAMFSDSPPDWDGTANVVAPTPQNNDPAAPTWTWRNDLEPFAPSRIDYFTYTDSRLQVARSFSINTSTMSAAQLTASNLQPGDTALNLSQNNFDHLPLVADFRTISGDTALRWRQPVSGSWWTAGNWNLNRVPTANDTVFVDPHGTRGFQVTIAQSTRVANLIMHAGSTLRVEAGATLRVDGLFSSPDNQKLTLSGGGIVHVNDLTIGQTPTAPAALLLETPLLIDSPAITRAMVNQWITNLRLEFAPSSLPIIVADHTLLPISNWRGIALDDSFVLVTRATLAGDANLDGAVNFPDLLLLASNYGRTSEAVWTRGNFNTDTRVDFADLLLLAQNYQGGSVSADFALARSMVVPEPLAITTLALAGGLLVRRRR
jgi:endonuclease/exonuclease/phosphatase family metal-dependent hydrolase